MIVLLIFTVLAASVTYRKFHKYFVVMAAIKKAKVPQDQRSIAILRLFGELNQHNPSMAVEILNHWFIYGRYPQPVLQTYSYEHLVELTKKIRWQLLS